MAIRDTWLVSERKGSVSTLATSPSSSFAPRKSISAMGLDTEDQLSQHLSLQERLRQIREKRLPEEADDTESVVSLSLTEEIALYTTDVQTVEANAGRARRSVGNAEMAGSPFVWNLPDWGNGRLERLPELSPAPELVIADPFARSRRGTAISMQRGESGMLDPVLSPVPAYSPTVISSEDASLGHGEGVQWSTASPFGAPRPSLAQTSSWYSAEDHSPTSPGFPPASPLPPSPVSPLPVESLRSRTAEMRASLRPTSTARSPHSPRSFGISETSYEMRATSRLSYSHPRPPVDYESENGSQYSATPRLVGADWGGSPMSSLFECQTPHQAMFDVTEAKEEDGEDLHEQFCSVLLLDLGDGRTVGLGGERGLMAC
uniref:Uncharacterized protein n=2 Tax=Kalmanozyma brasiliensis (strain GHG001) TaxID=1365824 RepID=V5F0U2_KALBG